MLSRTINASVKRQVLFQKPLRTIHISSIVKNAVSPKQEPQQQGQSNEELTWTRFFELRKQERTINLASSVATALLTSTLSWNVLANIEIDPTQMIFGFDPFMIFFAGFITSGGFGFLVGPFFGNLVFRLKNSSVLRAFNVKDKEFLHKITKNRVDPSSQSFSNPVPDYYGEKILNLKGYRNWLRDCNAYRRKAKEFL